MPKPKPISQWKCHGCGRCPRCSRFRIQPHREGEALMNFEKWSAIRKTQWPTIDRIKAEQGAA